YFAGGFEIKKGDIVVDIGAHIGLFSLCAAQDASKVYAFEPLQDNFKLLEENIKQNNCKNIFPFQMAVARKTGQQELFINDNSLAPSLYINRSTARKVMVPTTSLEKFVEDMHINKISFL